MRSPNLAQGTAGVILLCATSLNAVAENGLRPIGIGAESATLGGATVAKSLGATSQFSNPAGLAAVMGDDVQTFVSYAAPITVRHRDNLGNDSRLLYDRAAATSAIGAAHRLEGQAVVLALGYLQLNANGRYDDLLTTLGTRDDLSLTLKSHIATGAVAWQINDALAVGAAVGRMRYESREIALPGTSSLVGPYFGYDTGTLAGEGNIHLFGLTYKTSPDLVIGFSYTSEVELPLAGDSFVHNQSALGSGYVTYRNVAVTGTRQPREITLGVLARIGERSQLAATVKQIGWASATARTELTASDPDASTMTPRFSVTSEVPWRNQNVIALGLEHELNDRTTLRFGYNYGRQPVVNDALTPIMSPIGERHFTAGISHRIDHWRLGAGLEYLARKSVTYTNANAGLFGGESTEIMESCTLHFGAAYTR